MHKKGIVHRDLKADNIMFHKGVIKIIDLGFSKRIENKLTKTPLGTIYAMAP
jgi:serine/threonine protein kinase